jgi:3-deoxy-7-phosphoheptulonate synthase
VVTEPLVPSASALPSTRRVSIGDAVIGGDAVHVLAGPCAVETGYLSHALAAARAGASVLRGCVFKPRTSPDSFQGIGADGLPLLDEARSATGLPVIAEPLEVDDIAVLTDHVDALMIGARSMHNTPLLRAAGRSGLPVIVKRGMSATYDEWLQAARYVEQTGNRDVVLCERGIRTFETATRNTLDVSAIAVLRERTDLPIAVDPSHAAGNATWVPALSVAAVAAGADALVIECHPEPGRSVCDAAQAITPDVLGGIVQAIRTLAPLVRRTQTASLSHCRNAIDAIDDSIMQLVERRATIVAAVQEHKAELGRPQRDLQRERELMTRLASRTAQLPAEGVAALMRMVIDVCLDAAASDDSVAEAQPDRALA